MSRFPIVPEEPTPSVPPWTPSPADPGDVARVELRFLRHAAAESTRVVSAVLVVVALLWWMLDPVVFAGESIVQRQFVWLRVGTLSAQAAIFLGLSWPAFARQMLVPWCLAWMFANAAWLGHHLAVLGGPETPWFHFTYMFAMVPVAIPMRLWERLASTSTGALLLAWGYFSQRPEGLSAPFVDVTVSFLVFAVALSCVAGHLATRSTLARHRQTEALRRITSTLELRVAQQTAELRALAEHLELAREAERAHIARELHDELGQELTALRFSVSLARQRFSRDPSLIGQNLSDIEGFVARTHENVRHLVADLRPRALAELGLAAGLEWLVDRARKQSDLEVELTMEGDLAGLSEGRSAVVFRVVQESLTNVLRHAQARHAWVRVVRSEEAVSIVVRDDGQGLASSDRPSGHGIVGMRERLRAVGGALSVTPSAEGGTRVEATLPALAAAA